MLAELMQKRIELLREMKPEARRFGLLGPADNAGVQAVLKQAQDAVRARGLDIRLLDAADAPSITRAFGQLSSEPVDALLVASILVMHHWQIVELAARFGIPAGFVQREILEAGGLLVLSPEDDARYQHAAEYAYRILQGANPADMPVMQPTEFWLGVNLRTARVLGLKIPQSILIRANRVLE
jgi:putative ABC transport system substrate-binding protein